MKSFLHHLLPVGLLFISVSLCSQNQPSFEQYHFNLLVLNPGYAGSKGDIEANLFSHSQWTKFSGAPSTQSLSIHSALANGKVGLGGKFLHDDVGKTGKYQVAIDYAYRLYTDEGVLAIGLEAALSFYTLSYGQLDAYMDGDPAFLNQKEQFWSPNAGAGIYFHNDVVFAGISAPVLVVKSEDAIINGDTDESGVDLFDAYRHYFATAGVLIKATDNFSIKPYTLVKYVPNTPVQIDGSISFIFFDSFWLGTSYRTDNSISLMAEYFFKKNNILSDRDLGFGYAYNFRLDEFQSIFGPTHELFLSVHFNKKDTRIKSPRFF